MKNTNKKSNNTIRSGISIGAVIAIILSYTTHKSILWAIIHGIFGWWYVLYHIFVY